MFTKPLVILSTLYSLVFFNFSAGKVDSKIADSYSKENYTSANASAINVIIPSILDLPYTKPTSPRVSINSKYFALIDYDSGQILTSKSEDTRTPIASTTKIMTAIIALEKYNLDDVVTVPLAATSQTPTVVNLRSGEKITILELLHCLLIKSGNDAAYTIASFMDQPANNDIKPFVEKMNQKASDLGMNNTHYLDPAGLDDNGYSTAYDLAVITRYALKNPTFRQIVKTPDYVAKNTSGTIFHQLENSNRLITTYQYPGAIGVKTGFTYAASHSLVGAAQRENHTLIAVILSTYVDTASASADEARELLDWGFGNVNWPN